MIDVDAMRDIVDLPVMTIRVVAEFEMDESKRRAPGVLWLSRSVTVELIELLSPCTGRQGGRLMGQFVQAAVQKHTNNGSALEASDDRLMEEYPAIFDFLTCCVGEGGKPRAVGSLTLFARTGSWHGCLKDRQTKRTWWGEGDTVWNAMKALDAALQGA